jgi:hypothetical protein
VTTRCGPDPPPATFGLPASPKGTRDELDHHDSVAPRRPAPARARPPGLFFGISTAADRTTALLFDVPVIVSGAGRAAPAAFLVAAATLAALRRAVRCDRRRLRLLRGGEIEAIPLVVLGVFAAGVGAALWLRVRDAVRYRELGRVALDEA